MAVGDIKLRKHLSKNIYLVPYFLAYSINFQLQREYFLVLSINWLSIYFILHDSAIQE